MLNFVRRLNKMNSCEKWIKVTFMLKNIVLKFRCSTFLI